MKAYAIGHLRNVKFGPEIVEYLERIDATLDPFGGRFLVHGARPTVLEGNWKGDLIVIEFPDRAKAEAWYRSDAYQRIVPFRAQHSDGDIFIVDGVPEGHRAPDVLAA